ncbi:hypothetical protein [Dactylosporangium sp. NPDC000521]|uniref:hypothetical protein n=1 Tax=Dactylosporangium sp. NPDC000521 TaxID=3363975 RepID=UPI00368A892F
MAVYEAEDGVLQGVTVPGFSGTGYVAGFDDPADSVTITVPGGAAVLAHVRPQPTAGAIVFDAAGLRFVDHRALLHLHRYAERAGADAILHTSLSTVADLAAMICGSPTSPAATSRSTGP